MRFFFTILLISFSVGSASTQETETSFTVPISVSVNESALSTVSEYAAEPSAQSFNSEDFLREFEKNLTQAPAIVVPPSDHFGKAKDPVTEEPTDTPGSVRQNGKEKFHWKPALKQSMIFLTFQHAFRMTETKTREELGGPFFRDWGRSVKGLQGWRDSDNFATNYIAHPLQGGLTGRIFVNNSDNAKKQKFGKSKEYWMSRLRAFAWTTAWSIQFELGPISEASIGNVGIRKKNGYSTMAYVDLVMTPFGGTALLVGEDAIDKYVLKNWLERKSSSKMRIRILRSFLTPTISVANLLRGQVPWKRDDRPIPDF